MKIKVQIRVSFVASVLMSLFIVLMSGCQNKHPLIVTDIDGNVYHTVTIGTQTWMVENLNVTRYRNGDLIPNITDTNQWKFLPFGLYCNYSNKAANASTYGRLYNWYAVTDCRKIAPNGWHVPDISELEILVNYLGGDTVAAGKMKEIGYWLSPNTGATDQSGFSALPGGYRFCQGEFHTLGSNGYWWTTTQSFEMYAWSKRIYWYFANAINVHEYKTMGFSVRCIKDYQ